MDNEIRCFIENCEFPGSSAWDGFHVYINNKLEKFYIFRHRYSVSNMRLVGYNKRFLDLTVGPPSTQKMKFSIKDCFNFLCSAGSTQDARFLRNTGFSKQVLQGKGVPDKSLYLGEENEETLLTVIGDSAFARLSCSLKSFNPMTDDPKERYYNLILSSAQVVTENAYGILNGRWRKLYIKAEMKLHNLKYIIMGCVVLHNLCIAKNDPRKPRWCLTEEQ